VTNFVTKHFSRCASGKNSGTAALEFALVSLPFVALLLAILQVGLALYFQVALDYATQQSARQVQIGGVARSMPVATFVSNIFCPNFSPLVPCSGIAVDLRPVADYYSDPAVTLKFPSGTVPDSSFSFCPGSPGQLMFLRIAYQAPAFSQAWWSGTASTTRTIQSTTAFLNETASILSSIPVGGC